MPTSKRSFGLISLHVTVCPVGRKLTSPCLPARNKIRFARRQFISLTVTGTKWWRGGSSAWRFVGLSGMCLPLRKMTFYLRAPGER